MIELGGICGLLGMEDRKLLHKMCDTLSHRGPDGQGFYADENVGLGNRRLGKTTIEEGGQPIHNEDGNIWVTCDGTIYNSKELVGHLQKKGHRFYTSCDAEVIVHLYEEEGEECAQELEGAYAFAVWDGVGKRLLLARDRLGVKPLYYFRENEKLLFASEIKALLQFEEMDRKINFRALHNFLTFRFVPTSDTILVGIRKLPPSHILAISQGRALLKRYWSLAEGRELSEPLPTLEGRTRLLLEEAVRERLTSGIPLGSYLSGGLDSSSIVAIMSLLMKEPVKTFTAGFGQESDEFEYARKVSEHFETDHFELLIEEDDIQVLPKILWHFDEPLADPTAIPTYLLSKLAKNHVNVVLIGEGGDENFGGYLQYRFLLDGEKYLRPMPRKIRKIIPRIIDSIPSYLLDLYFGYSSALGEEAKKRFREFAYSIEDRPKAYLSIVAIFTEEEKKALYSEKTGVKTKNKNTEDLIRPYLSGVTRKSLLQRFTRMEIATVLPDNLLMKNDKMTQAASVEARLPFLSHKLMEFSIRLPDGYKMRAGKEKYILRKSMADLLPREIRRRKKQRFFVPIDIWLSRNLKEIAEHFLSEDIIKKRGYFKHTSVQRLFKRFQRSRLYYSRQLWNLVTLEIWHRIFLDSIDVSKEPKKGLFEI